MSLKNRVQTLERHEPLRFFTILEIEGEGGRQFDVVLKRLLQGEEMCIRRPLAPEDEKRLQEHTRASLHAYVDTIKGKTPNPPPELIAFTRWAPMPQLTELQEKALEKIRCRASYPLNDPTAQPIHMLQALEGLFNGDLLWASNRSSTFRVLDDVRNVLKEKDHVY